ncbi:hypothetical protein BRADI_5g07675v3 [Brachypodium distachyon]|uniref:C2H2-type domain-containing protein n=1 Tax=Brachypodium distachyon TaxID=15368 RepID=A0A0Q3KQH7_BRADI|nr:hypothetical protein BRADI_5g07675v3 [Brachypodium distachyon]
MAATRYVPRLTLSSSSSSGADDGDEPPRYYPWRVKSAHELDEGIIDPLHTSFECDICGFTFRTVKAIRTHMLSSHPDADQVVPPPIRWYICGHCGKQFRSWRALGGHRASHRGKKGCSLLSKQERAEDFPAMVAAAAGAMRAPPAVVRDFDLNKPAPEEEQEEEDPPP